MEVSNSLWTQKAEDTCTIIDGCALLWIPHWPASSPTKRPVVLNYVNKFKNHIEQRLKTEDVYWILDKYEDFSIKSEDVYWILDKYEDFSIKSEDGY